MPSTEKPIQLSNHARMQLHYRGATEEEVIQAIRMRPWQPAELGRKECRMALDYHRDWNGKHYRTKEIRPIFAEEKDAIVVVTVYVYYS